MAVRMTDAQLRTFGELRYEPTEKWLRASVGGRTVVDTTRALLVWEPRRPVPTYAVPLADLAAELTPDAAADATEPAAGTPPPVTSGRPVPHRGPFGAHTCDGQAFTVHTSAGQLAGAAFRPDDPGLGEHVLLDFAAFDAWFEENEPIVGHPRDPFHRVDLRNSSRQVRVEVAGQPVADSPRPLLLFETFFPVRYYLPPDDVRADLLRPTSTHTTCAYKGVASYWSLDFGEQVLDDVVWGYPSPLPDATAIAGRLCFDDSRVDVIVDGERLVRSGP
ncbi:MAG TPA: DUF427 domain-containing protein [Cryptosporangiaceae bacterium]|nr:DUF427 domain-containing protein [Cryptosporangiaceae bacterium]